MKRLGLLVWLACFLWHSGLGQTGKSGKTASQPQPVVKLSFAMAAAQRYEDLSEWEKAEEQYLKAGNDPTPGAQQASLAAIVRVRQRLKQQKRDDALGAAKLLEDQQRWKEAEQSYLDLLKSDLGAERQVAAGLARLQPRLWGKRWPEAFDVFAADLGRLLLVISILLALLLLVIAARTIFKVRRSVLFLPFQASSESSAKQVAFWLDRTRAELRSPAPPLLLSPSLISGLPFICMPDLPEQFPEPAVLEVGGVKLPLKQLTQIVGVPRVRVSGGWMVGSTTGDAYAEVERRRWAEFESHAVVTRTIVSSPGGAQDRDLRLFAYDVLIKAGSVYEH